MHIKWFIKLILGFFLILVDKVLCKLPTLTATKPRNCNDRWGWFCNDYPEAPIMDGEVLMSADQGERANNLKYFFDYSLVGPYPYVEINSDKGLFWTQTEINCKSLFETGVIRVKPYDFVYNAGRVRFDYRDRNHRNEIVLPSVGALTQYPLTRIRSCCGKNCPDTNLAFPVIDKVRFFVYRQDNKETFLTGTCEFCVLNSGVTSCNNGYFASDYLIVEPVCNKFSGDTCHDSEYVFYRKVSINSMQSPVKNALLEHGIHVLEHRHAHGKNLLNSRKIVSYVRVFRQPPEAGFTVAIGNQTANLRPAPGNHHTL